MGIDVAKLAEEVVNVLRTQYVLSYRELLAFVPLELLEAVVQHIVRYYLPRYDIVCETGENPSLLFYGAVRAVSLPELRSKAMACARFVRDVVRKAVEDACRSVIVTVNGVKLVKLSGNLYMDREYLYVYDAERGRLRRNMRWRVPYEKYRRGDRRVVIRWLGQKIESVLPCLELL